MGVMVRLITQVLCCMEAMCLKDIHIIKQRQDARVKNNIVINTDLL